MRIQRVHGLEGLGEEKMRKTYLAEFSDIANALSLQGAEIRGDATRLEIYDACEWLIEERSDGCDWEATGFGLAWVSCICVDGEKGLTAKVWIIALNPISTFPLPMISVTSTLISTTAMIPRPRPRRPTTWVIWFEESHFDALVGKVSLLLGQVDGSMIRRRMPSKPLAANT